MNVLLIEDTLPVQAVLQYHLEEAGFAVRVCESVECAINMLDEVQPDFIFQDIHLAGELDGYDALEHYRKVAALADIPIYLLTAAEEHEERQREPVRSALATGYISKPFDPQELIQKVQEANDSKG